MGQPRIGQETLLDLFELIETLRIDHQTTGRSRGRNMLYGDCRGI